MKKLLPLFISFLLVFSCASAARQGSLKKLPDADFTVEIPHGWWKPEYTSKYLITRDGAFRINADGYIVTSTGLRLGSEISLPPDTESINIGRDGIISILLAGESEPEEIGQLELVKFVNPGGLNAVGGNLYEETVASGPPTIGFAADEGFGSVLQGFLEKSNVDVVQEMINMIVAQRAYEINSKVVKTADDMMGLVNNLKR